MFAIAALIVFILALLIDNPAINLLYLGLALLSAHFVFGGFIPAMPWTRPPN